MADKRLNFWFVKYGEDSLQKLCYLQILQDTLAYYGTMQWRKNLEIDEEVAEKNRQHYDERIETCRDRNNF